MSRYGSDAHTSGTYYGLVGAPRVVETHEEASAVQKALDMDYVLVCGIFFRGGGTGPQIGWILRRRRSFQQGEGAKHLSHGHLRATVNVRPSRTLS